MDAAYLCDESEVRVELGVGLTCEQQAFAR
jgi:hypothetical protein